MDKQVQIKGQRMLVEYVERRIFLIRQHKVMLDSDLAELYGVETKVLNRAVRRNINRFPDSSFMFQLTAEEQRSLRRQFGTLKNTRGRHRKYRPMVFTEQGVAMLSSVLRSQRAIQVNIAIMKTFVKLRETLSTHRDLIEKLDALERKYDGQFRAVFEVIRQLVASPEPAKRKIGF